MSKKPQVKALVLGLMLGLASAQLAFAQSTTSSAVNGRVTDPEGRPVAGAVVEIVHVPSGTRKTVNTDAQGRYSSAGLRVGGPFTISVIKEGFEGAKREQLSLPLGETKTFNFDLESEATDLEAVEVVATSGATVFDPNNMGATSNVSRDMIDSLPSISRSLEDFVRTDPRITQIDKGRGGISVAGQNNRYNSITIDGVPTNDPFGLNDNGLASLNQPISLDTIEQVSIGVSGFDVSQSDFTGANINAITKSGTNEFSGTVYYNFQDNDLISDNPSEFLGFTQQKTYGFTLGGPILQDNLFFFVSYEKFEQDLGAPSIGLLGGNAVTNLRFISPADVARVQQVARTVYNFDVGTVEIPPGVTNEDDKLLVKLDWNINDSHRLSVRYNETNGEVLRFRDLNSGNFSLSTQWDVDDRTTESWVANLYSDWSASFSTELSVSNTKYEAVRVIPVQAPDVRIRFGNGAEFLNFGPDQFSHDNRLETETQTAFFSANWFLGDHTIKFGADYKNDDIFNLFGRDLFGVYTFNSIDDFSAGRFSSYSRRAAQPGQPVESLAADWELANLGFFVQDTWFVSPNLNILYGLRVDTPDVKGRPTFNQTFATAYGFRNDTTIDGNEIVQPRFGFNYTFDTERPTQFRGGLGLFAGSAANAWLSNPFSSTGLNFIQLSATNSTGFSFNPNNQPVPPASVIEQVVDVVDPNFEQPTVWKSNLAFDHELPWMGLVASAELLWTNSENAIFYQHLNLGSPNGRLPDGRFHYFQNTLNTGTGACLTNPVSVSQNCNRFNRNRTFADVLLLTNTNKGDAQNLTLSLEKPMDDRNWSAKLAWTMGRAEEVNPGTSSQAASNWNSRQIFNHDDKAETANYEIKDRVVLTYTHRWYFFGDDLATKFSVFGEGRSGRPFSYVFANDANGDRISGNDLFFIPNEGQVQFTSNTSAQAIQQFFAYINNNEYLSSNRGSVAERNANTMNWVNSFDVRFSQEIPGIFKGKGEVFLDIINFGNFLNDDWGQIVEFPFPFGVRLANFAGVDPTTGRYIYSLPVDANGNFLPTQTEVRDNNAQSRWAAQIGVRYSF